MLRISPNDCMPFTRGESCESRIELTCISKIPVTYKIQTTSPEKFRVRPRCGVLRPGESITVQVLLKPEHNLSDSSRDKFLVMGFHVPDGMDVTIPQLTELWKQKQNNSPDVEQHRLYCSYKCTDQPKTIYTSAEVSEPRSTVVPDATVVAEKQLAKQAKQLEKQLRLVQLLQCLTIIVLLLILGGAAVYHLRNHMGFGNSNDKSSCVEDDGCPAGMGL